MTATVTQGLPYADYSQPEAEIRTELRRCHGDDIMERLEQGSLLLDTWWRIWPPAAIALTAIAIGAAVGWLDGARLVMVAAVLMVLQGFLIANVAMVAHSMGAHRRRWFGPHRGRWQGLVLGTIAFLSGSIYRDSHLNHHRHVNTPEDQEVDAVDFDRWWKRVLRASGGPGFLASNARLLAPRAHRDRIWSTRTYHRRKLWADRAGRRKLVGEFAYVAVYWSGIAALAVAFPVTILLGYIVPLVFLAPLANALREATEHFDIDLSDPWQIATPYEPGWFMRNLGGHQVGTSHWVHHLFPDIPHWRLPQAWALMRPIAVAHGVEIRTSFLGNVWRYFRGVSRVWVPGPAGDRVDVPCLSAYGDPSLAAERRSPLAP